MTKRWFTVVEPGSLRMSLRLPFGRFTMSTLLLFVMFGVVYGQDSSLRTRCSGVLKTPVRFDAALHRIAFFAAPQRALEHSLPALERALYL